MAITKELHLQTQGHTNVQDVTRVRSRNWCEPHGFADWLIMPSEAGGFDSEAVLQVLQERFGM
jgi:hypothetical protein